MTYNVNYRMPITMQSTMLDSTYRLHTSLKLLIPVELQYYRTQYRMVLIDHARHYSGHTNLAHKWLHGNIGEELFKICIYRWTAISLPYHY